MHYFKGIKRWVFLAYLILQSKIKHPPLKNYTNSLAKYLPV